MSFRDNLLRLRTEHNMTQEQLASLVGVSRQSVAKWESDRSYPEMDKLIKLTGIFGCTLDELVMGPVGHDARDDDAAAGATAVAAGAPAAAEEVPTAFPQTPAFGAPAAGPQTPTAQPSGAEALPRYDTPAQSATAPQAPAPCAPATDAFGYDAHMRSFARRIAGGVAAIIAGVAVMLFADAAHTVTAGYHDESTVLLLFLLAGIAVGLALIIPAVTGHRSFMLEHPVVRDFYSTAEKRIAGQRLAGGIVTGIALIFMGVIGCEYLTSSNAFIARWLLGAGVDPTAAFYAGDDIAAGFLIACVAIAVWCFVYFGIMYSRVHVREYNHASLDELVDAFGEGKLAPEAMISQLTPEERRLLFDVEGIDGSDSGQVREFFGTKRRKGKLVSGLSAIIMIVATIVGLCLLFGIPAFTPYFWMAWVVGGLTCGIVSVAVNTFMK